MQELIIDTKEKIEKKITDYDFEALNQTDFQTLLTIYARNRLLKLIFGKCIPRLKRKGVDVGEAEQKLEQIGAFEVTPQYLKLIKLAIKGEIKKINCQLINEDRISILNYEIKRSRFRRDKTYKEIWAIDIWIEGQYHQRN